MPDGVSIPGGPSFAGFPQPPDVPCDPTGDGWRGPQGFPGQTGPQGVPGVPGVPGTGSYSVQDAAFGAVGDGTTNDATAINNAISAAAGRGTLRFPATNASGALAVYLIRAALFVPSNSHLIIEAGATIKIDDHANQSCFYLPANTSNVLIDLLGTLDGNGPNQTIPFPGGTASGGIVNGLPISDVLVDGHRQGVITNFFHWGVNIVGATNVEVRGVAITNCGNTPEFAGISTRHNVTSGTYTLRALAP